MLTELIPPRIEQVSKISPKNENMITCTHLIPTKYWPAQGMQKRFFNIMKL